jgi:hypothetical protein
MLLASSLPTSMGLDDSSPFDQALSDQSAWVVRAQSPEGASTPLVSSPPQGVSTYYPPQYPSAQALQAPVDNFANPTAPTYPSPIQDPFTPGAPSPYMAPTPGPSYYTVPGGLVGPQPIRYGWQSRYDFTWVPSTGTSDPNVGNFSMFGADVELIETKPCGYGWTFAIGPQFNYRAWSGPNANTPTTDLPGSAYRIGLDMALRTPTVANWTLEVGFDPSIAADFRSALTRDAYLFDGHIVGFWQMTPRLMAAVGALYWDRVNDIILPYAGLVWIPNDIWEFRLVFPKPRITAFLGTPWGIPTWLYAQAEYHVEAYQVKPEQMPSETRVQFADWRAVGGMRWEMGWLTSFIEAGYIFDRQVKYQAPGTEFNINNGFIGRAGFRY